MKSEKGSNLQDLDLEENEVLSLYYVNIIMLFLFWRILEDLKYQAQRSFNSSYFSYIIYIGQIQSCWLKFNYSCIFNQKNYSIP